MPGVTIDLIDELGLDCLYWYSAKYDASQFANCLKPTYMRHLGRFTESILYFDTDIAIFSPLDAMIAALGTNDVVTIPHMYAPFDRPERIWVHPNTADIFNSGLINAGCFGLRPANCSDFLAMWETANFAPGTFYADAGGQTDQQFFNWSLLLADRVHVLKDRAYNVAYWNMHERGLRLNELDDAGFGWTVDGKPLVFFHFSGYNPLDALSLSKHDGRYVVYNMPAVAAILAWYSDQLSDAGYFAWSIVPYKFDEMANGVKFNSFLRTLLKKYEQYIPRYNVQDVEEADELCRFLMSPLPATGSLLPFVAAEIYSARKDLQAAFPNSDYVPLYRNSYYVWFLEHAGREHGVGDLIAGFRRVLLSDPLVALTQDVRKALRQEDAELKVLGADRSAAAERLLVVGRKDLAHSLMQGRAELSFSTSIGAILAVFEHRPDLRQAYPFPFGGAKEGFAAWLTEHGAREHNVPQDALDAFRPRVWNATLARIFSYCCRREDLGELAHRHLLADDPSPLLRELVHGAGDELEYHLSDLEVLIFLHERERLPGAVLLRAAIDPAPAEQRPRRGQSGRSRAAGSSRRQLVRPWLPNI